MAPGRDHELTPSRVCTVALEHSTLAPLDICQPGEEAKSFYEHYGFVASPVDSLTMMMLLRS